MTNTTQIQQVLEWAVTEQDVPGIVAEVKDRDGGGFLSAGVADLRTGRPRRPGEHFHVGSAGKSFTSATMLGLEAEGRLSLDDTVEQWLPGLLDVGRNGYDGRRITIRHLLQNSSGLFTTGIAPDFTRPYATRANFERNRFRIWTEEELLGLAVSMPPMYEPGGGFAYSNGGFYLAGAIIEKATGSGYAAEVDRLVVKPLGLTQTHVRASGESGYPSPHATAYSGQFFKDGADPADVTAENWQSLLEGPELAPLDVTDMNTSGGWSAGNVVSTTSDMLAVHTAIVTGALATPAQHRAMWTTISTEGTHWIPSARYGLGVFEFDQALTGDLTLRGVGGSIWGSFFCAIGTPDGEHTIAFHTNTEFKSWAVLFKLIEAEFGIPLPAGI